MISPYWKRLVAEVLGTFGFLFIGFSSIAVVVLQPDAIGSAGVAAGFGLGLTAMIFAFGHISGGHFNPAVSLGLAIGRQFPAREVVGYSIAQVVGALIAVGASVAIYGDAVKESLVNAPMTVTDSSAIVLEMIFVALFVIVISAVATDTAPWSGVMAPLAIGGFIFVSAVVVGPFTGGAFNPARALAPAIYAGDYSNLWIYIIGPLLGGAIGGYVYALIRRREGDGELEEMVTAEKHRSA